MSDALSQILEKIRDSAAPPPQGFDGDMSRERLARIAARFGNASGRAMLADFRARDGAGFSRLSVHFDAQLDPRASGNCFVFQKRICLNPRAEDAELASTLAHELRHLCQPFSALLSYAPAHIEKTAMDIRAMEGDAFIFQLAYGLANIKEDPALHESDIAFFRARVPAKVAEEIEVGCDAFLMSRDDRQRAQCLRALYWTLQESYLCGIYDASILRRAAELGGQLPPGRAAPAETPASAASLIGQMQALPLPGLADGAYLGDPLEAALRIRRSFHPALDQTITGMQRFRASRGSKSTGPRP